MRRNAVIPLVLGLAIGLAAVKFGVDAIRKAKASGGTNITAVRAKVDINAYEEIRADMVEAVETTDSLFAPTHDRIPEVTKAVGRVTCKAIPKSAPVLMSMLAPEGTKQGMVGRIPTGFRGVSLKIDEVSGVAYQIKVGDWVDVSVVMDIESDAHGKKDVISDVLLQRVRVAAVGYGQQEGGPDSAAKIKPAKSATLLVKEEDVPKLQLAMVRGKVALALRPEDDVVKDAPNSAFESEMGGRKSIPEPSKPEPVRLVKSQPKPEPLPDPEVPHVVSVFHRAAGTTQAQAIEQVTFENAKSARIVAVQIGQPNRAAAALSGSRERSRPTPASRNEAVPEPVQDPGREGGVPDPSDAIPDPEPESDEQP